ncbi:hypothetical protein [uncultured Alistipes sp.]|uniref:hypothetical protein n=1 Tax=uncultured Alistipes sp. TaxID=538949 RepID=UPI00259BA210|nr:hypothetical protein [uncultured Alistipes sp.]
MGTRRISHALFYDAPGSKVTGFTDEKFEKLGDLSINFRFHNLKSIGAYLLVN